MFGYVVREAVTNVLRHSDAELCTVRIGPDWVEATDNGGYTGGARAGNGLTGLTERLAAVSDTLEHGPTPGDGFRVLAPRARPGEPPRTITGRRADMIRVLLADDQALVRGALAAVLLLEPDIDVVAEIGTGTEVLAAAQRTTPDIALLDVTDARPGRPDRRRRAPTGVARLPHHHLHDLQPARLPLAGDGRARGRLRREGLPVRTTG
ncbi:hypothetical protein [Streptomyces sp. S186]|uniref:hypothetical protein n=1 Tax=Streptomyces sp. S186 TaxID=3434395 RepID=UPI003F679713